MQANIITTGNAEKGKMKLPSQFDEPVRLDLIKRAVNAIQSKERQAYSSSPLAGQRHSAKLSRRRRDYKGSYGLGISRVPRKVHSRRGTRMNWVGAESPGTVGGRRAHPPKAYKDWENKINKKENRKAIRSALAATVSKEWVEQRGNKLPQKFPIIIDNEFENISNTKKLNEIIQSLGIQTEVERKIRVGKGKHRGRKYKQARGSLIIVSKECPAVRAAANISGLEICEIQKVNCEILAPGAVPGRLTIYSQQAIEKLEKEQLFK